MVADQYSLIAVVIENCSSIDNSTKVNDCLEAGCRGTVFGVRCATGSRRPLAAGVAEESLEAEPNRFVGKLGAVCRVAVVEIGFDEVEDRAEDSVRH